VFLQGGSRRSHLIPLTGAGVSNEQKETVLEAFVQADENNTRGSSAEPG
jgi:hypothetical protein